MIYISPDIKIRSTIKTGSVFYFVEDSFNSPLPHNFIVLNKNPLTDNEIIMVNITSDSVGRKKWVQSRKLPNETLVFPDKNSCPFLSHDSVINCNDVTKHSIESLIEKTRNGRLQMKNIIDSQVLKKVIQGVIASPLVDEIDKKRL